VDAAPSADAGDAYGPDDPAYGPPGPDWYSQEPTSGNERVPHSQQATMAPAQEPAVIAKPAEAAPAARPLPATQPVQAARPVPAAPAEPDPPVVRGPFEPLVETRGQLPNLADAGTADGGVPDTAARSWDETSGASGGTPWNSADTDLAAAAASPPEYEPFPGLADDEPIGSADGALDRLKALHLTAEAVAPQSLDAHFDQLLERQRKLISEYLSQAEGPGLAAGVDDGESLVGLGDDHRSAR
jgi:hypothetical protein